MKFDELFTFSLDDQHRAYEPIQGLIEPGTMRLQVRRCEEQLKLVGPMQEMIVLITVQTDGITADASPLGTDKQLWLLALLAPWSHFPKVLPDLCCVYSALGGRVRIHPDIPLYNDSIQMSQLVIEVLAADKLPNIGLNRPPSAYVYKWSKAAHSPTAGSSMRPISRTAPKVPAGAIRSCWTSQKSI